MKHILYGICYILWWISIVVACSVTFLFMLFWTFNISESLAAVSEAKQHCLSEEGMGKCCICWLVIIIVALVAVGVHHDNKKRERKMGQTQVEAGK